MLRYFPNVVLHLNNRGRFFKPLTRGTTPSYQLFYKAMYTFALFLTVTWTLIISIHGDVKTVVKNPGEAININAVALNSDLIWTDEKNLVTYLPDKAKRNGKATGFRDIIMENAIKIAFKRIMEKIRNPHLFRSNWGITDPMPLAEKINMKKNEDLYT